MVFFTDGSALNNGKKHSKGAYAYASPAGIFKDTTAAVKMVDKIPPTNIRAEGFAILAVFKFLSLPENICKDWNTCIIYTDS